VYLYGKVFHSELMVLRVFFRGDQGNTRFGFVPSKKIKKAVQRNLVKRRLREICRFYYPFLKPGYDVVVNVKVTAVNAPYPELRDDFYGLLRRAGLLAD